MTRRIYDFEQHILRNEYELNKIKKYVINNPLKCELDIENPNKDSEILGEKIQDDGGKIEKER